MPDDPRNQDESRADPPSGGKVVRIDGFLPARPEEWCVQQVRVPPVLQQVLDLAAQPFAGPEGEEIVPDPEYVKGMQELSVRNARQMGLISEQEQRAILIHVVGLDPAEVDPFDLALPGILQTRPAFHGVWVTDPDTGKSEGAGSLAFHVECEGTERQALDLGIQLATRYGADQALYRVADDDGETMVWRLAYEPGSAWNTHFEELTGKTLERGIASKLIAFLDRPELLLLASDPVEIAETPERLAAIPAELRPSAVSSRRVRTWVASRGEDGEWSYETWSIDDSVSCVVEILLPVLAEGDSTPELALRAAARAKLSAYRQDSR